MAILDSVSDYYARVRQWIEEEANFFRLHLIFFTFTPLVAAGIFYGVNGEFHISFIDSLFVCYSALTVTGLSTINLSTLTVFQQVILLVLMTMGDVTIIAWIMVLVRMRYFKQHIIATHRKKTVLQSMRDRVVKLVSGVGHSIPHRHVEEGGEKHLRHTSDGIHASDGIGAALAGGAATGLGLGIALGTTDSSQANLPKGGRTLEDPSQAEPTDTPSSDSSSGLRIVVDSPMRASPSDEVTMNVDGDERGMIADAHSFTSSPRSVAIPLQSPTSQHSNRVHFPPYMQGIGDVGTIRRRPGVPVPRRRTIIVPPKVQPIPSGQLPLGQRNKDQGLGGFPGPWKLGKRLARRMFPDLYARLERMMIRERSTSKEMKWLSDSLKDLVIGRNSEFHTEELTDEQLEELGGIEYRALRLLSWIVILYFIGTQMISFILIAPWLSTTHTYDSVFASQPRLVNKSWFAVFQVVGAYTGGGMSLVDAGMVPFQTAYLMIFAMIFVILAGNHGMPIFLRFVIWVYTKFVKPNSPKDAALDFLLDHPRRCFLYLFPSHVTWYLAATLVFFTIIELVCFIVFDIGLQVTDSLSPGTRVVAGLFQSFAVRASGFSIVSISALAPSFQFLCVIMMYIAIYPVALSIRSTNVYEEKSLGVFEASPEDEDEEPNLNEEQPRHERIGKYFSWHLRRQLAFDIWWLVFAILAVCIIERTKIMDDDNAPWFNIFRIVFELVSAFGGIGLTLGIPTQNYSFSGAFGPLSKIVVIIIMVRGRHRGLPVAIDRAILLPEDLKPNKAADQASGAPATEPQALKMSEKEMMHAA
ncbi:TrkH-domain-containing protein [Trametes coccinea BRFM310]|uniref:TrkH-domain-containing protein n=1 Tax=Trametes coccinea (strain BRFM310) TaxID=1353009 RepID=A0A1Y2IX86_TRAC3|nr:TrkH-domain-containing protein [Trametes coccinea BRFM310]